MHTHHRGDAMLYIHPVAGSFFFSRFSSRPAQLQRHRQMRCKKKLKNPNFFFYLCLSFSQFAAQTLHVSGSAANQ